MFLSQLSKTNWDRRVFMMIRKRLIYSLVVWGLEAVSLLLTIICIIKFIPYDNYLTGLAFLSAGLCVLNGVLMIFHVEKLFSWYYKKSELALLHNRPEFFSTSSTCLAPKEKAYKTLKFVTLTLLGINILLQTVLVLI